MSNDKTNRGKMNAGDLFALLPEGFGIYKRRLPADHVSTSALDRRFMLVSESSGIMNFITGADTESEFCGVVEAFIEAQLKQ